MKLDFQPTPEQAGHAIGLSMRYVPLISSVREELLEALKLVGIPSEVYINERYLLSACAALSAISQCLQDSPYAAEVTSGFLRCLVERNQGTFEKYVLERLNEARGYYDEAARSDENRIDKTLGGVSEIELAFGDRVFANIPETQEMQRAYLTLSLVTPKAIWDSQFQMVLQMLTDAGLLNMQ
jgi:hypothetical protein